jgi:3-deoxy-D-manno-octulosonic-acid transferase
MISEHVSLAVAALQQAGEPARERIAKAVIAKASTYEQDGEAGWVGDQDPPALGQDRVVGGVPRHPERLGDPGDRQVRQTIPASAQRSPPRDSLARGSAALLVSWRQTGPQPAHR